jgi:hypothetical protein
MTAPALFLHSSHRPPEGRFVHPLEERVTLGQVWPELTGPEQEVLAAAGAFRTPRRAADSLGLAQAIYAVRLRWARAHALGVWHDDR